MCDETTEAENELYLARLRLSRRELGVGAGTMVAALVAGCGSASEPNARPDPTPGPAPAPPSEPAKESTQAAAPLATRSRMTSIDAPDGSAEGFFVAPDQGKHPGVLIWPDIAGVRDAFKQMATRLAGQGYAVLVVNQYYRSSKLPVFSSFAEFRTEEGRAKIGPMRAAITPEGTAADGAAFVAWLDAQPEVDTGKKGGTTGYCMGGPYTFRTAAAVPARVGAFASFHGGGLVTEDATSPHRLLPQIKGAALICVAQNDDERKPDAKDTLKQAALQAEVPAEIEVYPAQHGWCVTDSPVYDEPQAERAWARLLATFQAHL